MWPSSTTKPEESISTPCQCLVLRNDQEQVCGQPRVGSYWCKRHAYESSYNHEKYHFYEQMWNKEHNPEYAYTAYVLRCRQRKLYNNIPDNFDHDKAVDVIYKKYVSSLKRVSNTVDSQEKEEEVETQHKESSTIAPHKEKDQNKKIGKHINNDFEKFVNKADREYNIAWDKALDFLRTNTGLAFYLTTVSTISGVNVKPAINCMEVWFQTQRGDVPSIYLITSPLNFPSKIHFDRNLLMHITEKKGEVDDARLNKKFNYVMILKPNKAHKELIPNKNTHKLLFTCQLANGTDIPDENTQEFTIGVVDDNDELAGISVSELHMYKYFNTNINVTDYTSWNSEMLPLYKIMGVRPELLTEIEEKSKRISSSIIEEALPGIRDLPLPTSSKDPAWKLEMEEKIRKTYHRGITLNHF